MGVSEIYNSLFTIYTTNDRCMHGDFLLVLKGEAKDGAAGTARRENEKRRSEKDQGKRKKAKAKGSKKGSCPDRLPGSH